MFFWWWIDVNPPALEVPHPCCLHNFLKMCSLSHSKCSIPETPNEIIISEKKCSHIVDINVVTQFRASAFVDGLVFPRRHRIGAWPAVKVTEHLCSRDHFFTQVRKYQFASLAVFC